MEADALQGIDEALGHLERIADGETREQARQLVGAVLALHREGLARLLEHFCGTAESRRQFAELARQEPLHSLLALHDLHPEDVQERIERALGELHPQVQVSLVECNSQEVVLRLEGQTQACPSTLARQRQLIEAAVVQAAPDAAPIRIQENSKSNLQLQLRVL